MTDNMPKLLERTGKIIDKEAKKVYDKGEWYGNTYYKLKVNLEQDSSKSLFVYSNIVSKQIFKDVEQSQYLDKRYLFFCEKRPRGFLLHNWRELSNNGSDFNKSQQLENHEKK